MSLNFIIQCWVSYDNPDEHWFADLAFEQYGKDHDISVFGDKNYECLEFMIQCDGDAQFIQQIGFVAVNTERFFSEHGIRLQRYECNWVDYETLDAHAAEADS